MPSRKIEYVVPTELGEIRFHKVMNEGREWIEIEQDVAGDAGGVLVPLSALGEVSTTVARLADYYRPGGGQPGPDQGTLF